MNKEYRVFGPPGTGKTTYLSKQVKNAVKKHGPDKVLVSSLTKTAAKEIAGRLDGKDQKGTEFDPERFAVVDPNHVGTLHALCFRLAGRPEIADSPKWIKEWNRLYPPNWQQSSAKAMFDDATEESGSGDGDSLRAQIEIRRAQKPLCARDQIPMSCKLFYDEWQKFKKDRDLMDFTDLIELAYEYKLPAPGDPAVIFCDEVQDYSRLELELIRMWLRHDSVETGILAGDDDQAIFGFRGATPDAFLNPPIPDSQKTILSQSYRLPEEIKAFADSWIKRIGRREEKAFSATREAGQVQHKPYGGRIPDQMIHEARGHIASGKSVMILATCGYMLQWSIKKMRDLGMPFHNPYRAAAGHWNPMRGGVDRLANFLKGGDWTWKELWSWLEVLDAKILGLDRGTKNGVRGMAKDKESKDLIADWDSIRSVFGYDDKPPWVDRELTWLGQVLLNSKKKLMSYAIKVSEKNDRQALIETPKMTIGSIHSVKGGEADVVYLLPDISLAARDEMATNRDALRRIFYVGMTRARETLVCCKKEINTGLLMALK